MAYNDQTEYGRGLHRVTTLSTTLSKPADGSWDNVEVRVNWILITGGAAAEVVELRNTAGSVTYLSIPAAIGERVFLNLSQNFGTGGLALRTATAAGDVTVQVSYAVL